MSDDVLPPVQPDASTEFAEPADLYTKEESEPLRTAPEPSVTAASTRQMLHPAELFATAETIARVRQVLRFLRRHRLRLRVMAVLGALLGFGLYSVQPIVRTANFQVELVPQIISNPVTEYARGNVEFFSSAQHNFVALPLIARSLSELDEGEASTSRLSGIRDRLELKKISGNTYEGTFIDADPDFVLTFLEVHFANYLEVEIDKTIQVIQAERDFLERQLQEAEATLENTEAELVVFKQENAMGLPEQASAHYQRLTQLQQEEQSLGTELSRILLEMNVNQKKLKGSGEMVQTRVLNTNERRQALLKVERDIAEAQAFGVGQDHPRMRALGKLRTQLMDVNVDPIRKHAQEAAEVESTLNPIYTAIQNSLYELEVEKEIAAGARKQTARDLERMTDVVKRLPEIEMRYALLTRSYVVNSELYTRILTQLNNTELQLALERASARARYHIIFPPTLLPYSKVLAASLRVIPATVVALLLALLWGLFIESKKLFADFPDSHAQE